MSWCGRFGSSAQRLNPIARVGVGLQPASPTWQALVIFQPAEKSFASFGLAINALHQLQSEKIGRCFGAA